MEEDCAQIVWEQFYDTFDEHKKKYTGESVPKE